MDTPLISVIVPVYKVEKYLDRCVQSIVDQTYRNLEIILVDDGSPDNCPAMCDAWSEKDSRVKVIHKANGGLSDARNVGLAIADGEYVSFVDSDDWLSEHYIDILYRTVTETNCDMAECGYIPTTGAVEIQECSGSVTVYSKDKAMELHLKNMMFKQIVWNKLYRRSILTVPFVKGKYHEDEFWTYRIVHNCQRLAHVDEKLYYYFQRSDSIMGEKYSLKRLDVVEALVQKLEFIKKYYPLLSDLSDTKVLFCCLYHGQMALLHLCKEERLRAFDLLRQAACRCDISKAEMLQMKLTHRCWLTFARIHFPLTCRIRNLLRIGL